MAGKKKSGYDGKIAGLYDLEETIGQGHFAVVKLARHVFTGEKVAVKVIDKQKLDDISRSHLFQEVRCMKLVQHPNVVRLYEVIDTQTKLYLILELGDGDMYDYIMKHDKGLDEQLAKKYFRQIVEAILYCHRLHVVHRDLKPENVVFFNKFGIVKLTDFGFSNVFAPGKKLETSCGSLAYSAPEILLGDSYDPPAVDVWSLGVILFMLVAGRAPFQEANDSETLTMIMDCKYQIPSHVSEQCRKLISKMLVREPSHRINLEDIEQDPWLNTDDEPSHQHINLPLLSRDHVSEEDHNYVVQKMVEGKICTREEIFQSLERDAYDHIAATYYLLVERRLRKLQQQEAAAAQSNNLRKQSAPSSSSAIGKPHLEPLMLSPRSKQRIALSPNSPSSLVYSEYEYSPFTRTQSIGSDHFDSSNLVQSLVSPPGTHPSPVSASPKMTHLSPEAMFAAVRKCSLIHEESQDDDDDDDLEDFEIGSELKPSKSLEFLDESGREHSGFEQSNPILVSSGSSHDSVNPRRPLKSVCSSPQLLNQLNQIHEENESEDEDDFVPLKLSAPRGRYSHSGMASPEILRKYEQRRRRKGAGQRGTSCSSSDASDTDDTEGRSRKEKLKHKFMHRRDSSDHSSDTDGPNGGPNSGGHLGSSGAGSKTSHRSRRDGGGGGGGGGGSSKGAGDKSGKSHSKQQHCFLSSDSKSSSEDPVDWPEVNDENIPQHIINIENSHNILSNNKRNQLTRQKPVNGVNGKMGGLGVLEGDFDLIAFSRKLSAISASSVSSGEGSVSSKSSSTKKQLTNCLTSVMVSPAPSPHKIQYIGHCPPQTKDSGSISQSIEFSQISDYCDRLMEDKPKVTICSGDFGLGPASRQAKSSLSGQNGLASTFCKVGSGSQVVQVESKCCSVV
ncbi:SNF-related serine/threonine-protein kinase-like isoform X3 [Biomphalaria glabrata]|uniref:SNF-related serine/threonine-protein kinase n=1 Tax=Biomphalaria glabrata TaxID=6526 RepID=A0A9W3AUT2_BIOGL|nr:SNF-related serine/threonine-protein kinase-like isoform X3 [Biomphalaria glabrata]